jgi:hypothetical protein
VCVYVCVNGQSVEQAQNPEGRELCMCLCGRNRRATPCRLPEAQAQQSVETSVSEHTRTKPSELYYTGSTMV